MLSTRCTTDLKILMARDSKEIRTNRVTRRFLISHRNRRMWVYSDMEAGQEAFRNRVAVSILIRDNENRNKLTILE